MDNARRSLSTAPIASSVAVRTNAAASVTNRSSDFVALYYSHYKREQQNALATVSSPTPPNLEAVSFKQTVPAEVKTRLDPYALTFSELPELLKRALLWESGFSLGDDASLAQIHTRCGLSMADIALSETEFASSSCTTSACTSAAKNSSDTTGPWSYATSCRADQLLTVAKCASTAVDTVSSALLWSSEPLPVPETDTNTPMDASIPALQVRRHPQARGGDTNGSLPAHVYAIHGVVPNAGAAACPLAPALAAVAIPCVPYQRTDPRWCRPARSDVMTTWLEEYAGTRHGATGAANTSLQGLDVTSGTVAAAAEYVKDEHGVYVRAAFRFNGSSSDFAEQLYRRHIAGDGDNGAVRKLVLSTPLPTEVELRLADASLQFDDLPALLQRALLWDTGFVLSAEGATDTLTTLNAVLVRCGLGMGDIAVSIDSAEQLKGSCVLQNCSSTASIEDRDNSTDKGSRRLLGCTDDRLASKSLCAVTAPPRARDSGSNTSTPSTLVLPMWAYGGEETAIPELSLVRRTWENEGRAYEMFAIHTSDKSVDTAGGTSCPEKLSMVIPCAAYKPSTGSSGSGDSGDLRPLAWCRPRPGVLVSSWLRQVAKHTQYSLLYLIPILMSVALTLTGLGLYIRRKTFKRYDHKTDGVGSMCANTIASTPGGLYAVSNAPRPSQRNTVAAFDTRFSMLSSSPSSIESFAAFSSNHVLNTLVNHPSLRLHTVPYDQLQFVKLLSKKGAKAEVWLASMHGTHVALKRLTRARKAEYDELDVFMREVMLNASLEHPNVASFVGVAWTTLQNLCVLTEYVAHGDLRLYLRQHCLQLAWEKAKLHIAMGIAHAIDYLHTQQPAVLHGSLESRAVLLTPELDAKLIGVGAPQSLRASRHSAISDAIESAPFWTAPEVLVGELPSEKSDIYALGVILSELDTHQTPYEGLKCMDTGADLSPLEILQLVATGDLKPSASPFCPLEITELIDACLHVDPDRRPSASEVVALLAEVPVVTIGAKTYSF